MTEQMWNRASDYVDREITKYRNHGNTSMMDMYDNILTLLNELGDRRIVAAKMLALCEATLNVMYEHDARRGDYLLVDPDELDVAQALATQLRDELK